MIRRTINVPLLAASLIVSVCFGSIHAYSVLLVPVEALLGVRRAAASLGYSTAILSLTAGVYLHGRLLAHVTARAKIFFCGIIAASGLVIFALSPGIPGLIVGFGFGYGLANGAAYSLSLELASKAMPERQTTAMGLATAAYGLGAVLFAQFFGTLIGFLEMRSLLFIWAAILLVVCMVGATLTRTAAPDVKATDTHSASSSVAGVFWLWTTYLLGAFGGLMILAHAPNIAIALSGPAADASLAAGVVSGGSIAGGYLGGLLAGRFSKRLSIALPMLTQAFAAVVLLVSSTLPSVIGALSIVGLCYGALISVIPGVVRNLWETDGFAVAYGKVFTAWGIAGLAGPIVAGFLFDIAGTYSASLVITATFSMAAAVLTKWF